MSDQSALKYMNGFGNEFISECPGYEGTIPEVGNNPQHIKGGLFAEQLSGSAFTAPRHLNKRSWLYRFKPSVQHSPFREFDLKWSLSDPVIDPNQKRWKPFSLNKKKKDRRDFIEGIETIACSEKSSHSSIAIHIYISNCNSKNRCLVNSDGDLLIVPQLGILNIQTEFGKLTIKPNEICVIQQGMKFSVSSPELYYNVEMDYLKLNTFIRGYILEVKGNHFELPQLGPIGANGLANPRDFQVPVAFMDDTSTEIHGSFEIIHKFRNRFFLATQEWSFYNVAAWFGNYTPYKYDLDKFVSVNSVSIDHPDPSIFTVLTCPLIGKPGVALADFVIFPPRWECASETFRPPYYHRNCMTEFMGLIKGSYQAKSAFAPGGATLHHAMVPHGPDTECLNKAIRADTTKPSKVGDETMAFMFETYLSLRIIRSEIIDAAEDKHYHECWQGLDTIMAAYKNIN